MLCKMTLNYNVLISLYEIVTIVYQYRCNKLCTILNNSTHSPRLKEDWRHLMDMKSWQVWWVFPQNSHGGTQQLHFIMHLLHCVHSNYTPMCNWSPIQLAFFSSTKAMFTARVNTKSNTHHEWPNWSHLSCVVAQTCYTNATVKYRRL